MAWGGGKDAALAFERVRGEHNVTALLTTFGEKGRSSMHGVRRELIEAQSEAADVPLVGVELPDEPSNEEYKARMDDALSSLADEGVGGVVFGDIFLEEVRAYREKTTPNRFETVFPLWGGDTDALGREAAEKFEVVTVCVDGSALGDGWAGRRIDDDFLNRLPASVDPCGENGEFHTFVADAPFFEGRIEYEKGEVVERELEGTTYYYQDLLR